MCGIAGLIGFQDQGSYISLLQEKLHHRGPDGKGAYMHDDLLLVHTRLSIIDTSSAGNQPLFSEDGTIALVCNGEIYNFQPLRRELESKGHQFSSHSDSEVIIHLYEEMEGNMHQVLHALRGMFAFALYDSRRRRLLVARDRFGIKPLYWYTNGGSALAFASEIRPLVSLPFVPDTIDPSSLYEYFQYLSVPEPNTIYSAVKAVEAGHYLEVSGGRVTQHAWYDAIDKLARIPLQPGEPVARLREKLRETVGVHMIADVPVGSFLSAGIDSTLVTQIASGFTDIPFVTVSAAFAGTREDESKEAAGTAAQLGLPHHAIDLGERLLADPSAVYRYFDQPFGVPSAYSLFHIAAGARPYMKVVLTGDGGDEVFAGYDHKHIPFYKSFWVRHLPLALQRGLGPLFSALPRHNCKELGAAFSTTDGERFLNRTRVLSEERAWNLVAPSLRKEIDTQRLRQRLDGIFRKTAHLHPVRQMQLADFDSFLKSEMLYKVDRMTMANGIEARVPLLDHELVEMAFSIPVEALRQGELGKIPLRKMVAEALPAIGTRKKTGFLTPEAVLARHRPQGWAGLDRLVNIPAMTSGTASPGLYETFLQLGLHAVDKP